MQPNENLTITRRSLDVEDYIDILRRHKGWIFGPFLLCVVASVVGVFLWPDSFVSEALIKITPQQVPESLVPSSINQQMWDRITSMEQTILSRSVLTTIIQNNGLYKSQMARMPTSDVVELMKSAIRIEPIGQVTGNARIIPAFKISFAYSDAHLAQRVVSDLVGKFIDENIRNRSTATFATTRFMQDETDRAKKELEDVENRLAEFQLQNNGRLPDQADANMHSLMALEAQLSSLSGRISSASSDKLQLETALRILKDQQVEITKQSVESPAPTLASIQRNERLVESEREVQSLEDTLRQLRQKYGESHPDVQTIVGRLSIARQKHDEILKEEAAKKEELAKKPDPATVARANPIVARDLMDRKGRIEQLQSQIEAKNLEVEGLNRDLKNTNDSIKLYEGRLSSVPMGLKAYTDLLRDRDIAKTKYVDLNDRLERAKRSEEMETRKQGEQLEPLDPASLPTDPTEPKRPMVIAIGSGLGLLLGVVIAGAREMKDTSLKNLKDVRAYTQMAVLGSIPLLENDFVVRRRRRLAWLGWTTACMAAVVVMVGAIVYYYESTRGGGIQ